MTNVHKCLVELQSSPKENLKNILKRHDCVLTFEDEFIDKGKRCVVILSDGENQITSSSISNVDYSSEATTAYILRRLLDPRC